MEDQNELQEPLFAPIPELFYSDLTGQPMEECKLCECSLLEGGVPYLVEKAFRVYHGDIKASNTVFEYAICMHCAMEMKDQLSEDSKKSMEKYMLEKGNLTTRAGNFLSKENPLPADWWQNCLITGQNISGLEEYQICGVFEGNRIICAEMPYLLSGDAMDEMTELLSPETRDELNRFGDEHFSGPPELKELFEQRPVLLY